jgi:hypothetical protein
MCSAEGFEQAARDLAEGIRTLETVSVGHGIVELAALVQEERGRSCHSCEEGESLRENRVGRGVVTPEKLSSSGYLAGNL